MSKDEVQSLLNNLGKRMRDKIIDQAKILVKNEEEIIEILNTSYPKLTATEIELCCYIVVGKTVSEICDLRHVSPSTITSLRSRLRKKFGLKKDECLKTFLQTTIAS
jgi:DNA-binding CsgD family transcriptional regulator